MARNRVMWFALGIVYLVWGSTYLAISYAVDTIPPFLGAAIRFGLAAGLLAAGLAATGGARRLRVTGRELASAAVVGALLLAGGNGVVMIAEQTVPSGTAALGVASVPLFVVLLRLAARDRPPLATLAGVALGFAGIATLVHPGGAGGSGILIVLVAAASWSLGSFLSPRLAMPADALVGTTYEMVFGGALLLVMALARGEFSGFSLGQVSAASWTAIAYLVVFGSLVAFSAYVWLLQNAPLSTVSTYAYVNPAVAVALGTIAGEPFTWRLGIGGAAVIAAVAIVVSTESHGRRRAALPPAEDQRPAPRALDPVEAQCAPGAAPRR